MTLRSITGIAPVGSAVIFDYLNTGALVPEIAAPSMKEMLLMSQQAGEPFMNPGFDPSTLAVDLAGLGLRLHENWSPTNIDERYFQGRTDGYHASEHLYFARAVVE